MFRPSSYGRGRGGRFNTFHKHMEERLRASNPRTPAGNLKRKPFEEGDDKLALEPDRYHESGLFLCKRYRQINRDGGDAFLMPCSCIRNYFGGLCHDCSILNTSAYNDLRIPINPEDFERLRGFFLDDQKWSENDFHDWLVFWIHLAETKFHSERYVDDSERAIFFDYDKFYRICTHQFFLFVCKFVIGKAVLHPDPPRYEPRRVNMEGRSIPRGKCFLHVKCEGNRRCIFYKTMPNSLALITCHALIRLTFKIYKEGRRVVSINTKRRCMGKGKSIIVMTPSS